MSVRLFCFPKMGQEKPKLLPDGAFQRRMIFMFWKKPPMLKLLAVAALFLTPFTGLNAADTKGPVKVFILAGDANCLEQGVILGRTEGKDAVFYPNQTPVHPSQVPILPRWTGLNQLLMVRQ